MNHCAFAKTTFFLFVSFMLLYTIPNLLDRNPYSHSFVMSPFSKVPSSVSAVESPLSISTNTNNYSLREQHFKTNDSDVSEMLERGNVAMGFDQKKISHQFIPLPDGGIIRISALDSSDYETITQIKSHAIDIQKEFSNGNFTKPFFIHAQNVPGTEVMNLKREMIEYRIEDIENGASLILFSNDKELTRAINQFMEFQAGEHKGH